MFETCLWFGQMLGVLGGLFIGTMVSMILTFFYVKWKLARVMAAGGDQIKGWVAEYARDGIKAAAKHVALNKGNK